MGQTQKFFNQTFREFTAVRQVSYECIESAIDHISLRNVCKKKFLNRESLYYVAEDVSEISAKEIIIQIDTSTNKIRVVFFHKNIASLEKIVV